MSKEIIAFGIMLSIGISFFIGYLFGMNSDISDSVRNLSKLMDYDRMKEENEHLQEALNIKNRRNIKRKEKEKYE